MDLPELYRKVAQCEEEIEVCRKEAGKITDEKVLAIVEGGQPVRLYTLGVLFGNVRPTVLRLLGSGRISTDWNLRLIRADTTGGTE